MARLLVQSGFGTSQLTVLEALGGPRERMRTTTAAGFDLAVVDALNTVAIEVDAAPGARIVARSSGLADDLFEPDGQITKRDVRALTLSCSRHVGASSCGISAQAQVDGIEWLLAHPLNRTIAVEKRGDRAARSVATLPLLACPVLRLSKARPG